MDTAVSSNMSVAECGVMRSYHSRAIGSRGGTSGVTASSARAKTLSSVLSAMLVLAAMLFSLPAQADRGNPWDGNVAPADYYAVVGAVEGLNVRMYPSADWDRLTTLGYGTRVHVIGSAVNFDGETWLKLDSGGWVIATGVVQESQYQPPAPPEPEPSPAEKSESDSEKNSDGSDSNKDAADKEDKAAADKNDKEDASEGSKSDKSKEELAAEEAESDSGFWVIIAVLVGVAVACIGAVIALVVIFLRGKSPRVN